MTIWALGLFFLSLFGSLLGELFFGELSGQDAQDVIQRLLLEVGLLEQLLTASTEHGLGRRVVVFLEAAEDPRVDLVAELIQVDVLLGVPVAEDLDAVARQQRGELEVGCILTDSQGHLVGAQVDLGLLALLIEGDGGGTCRAEGALDEE